MNCSGDELYFYLQSGLIAVIWSKLTLGLTTSLTWQTKLGTKSCLLSHAETSVAPAGACRAAHDAK